MQFKIEGIETSNCIKCESCIKICSVKLFSKRVKGMEKEIIFEDPYGFCFHCGHCISVCPTNAIKYSSDESTFEFDEARNPAKLVDFDTLYKFIRARRSIRVFKEKDVEKEKIMKILETMRYAPSASNRQKREFVVITNKELIKELSAETTNLIKKIQKLQKIRYLIAPFISRSLRRRLLSNKLRKSLELFFDRTKKGEDLIFFNAPCVIILHSSPYANMAPIDAGIAFTHGMFAAQSLGLGTCWIGYAQEYLVRNRKLRNKLGIPKHHQVYGVLAVGYPAINFLRAPPRNKVRWTLIE